MGSRRSCLQWWCGGSGGLGGAGGAGREAVVVVGVGPRRREGHRAGEGSWWPAIAVLEQHWSRRHRGSAIRTMASNHAGRGKGCTATRYPTTTSLTD